MKIERQVKRNTEVDTSCNNIKLLTEMLNHYSPSSPSQDKELMKVRNIIFMVQWTYNTLIGLILSFMLSLHSNYRKSSIKPPGGAYFFKHFWGGA